MSVSTEIYHLINQLYTVELIMKALRVRPRDYLGEELYDNESHTLEMIVENEGISQAGLTEKMFRTKGSTSVMVDKLIEKGLVFREKLDSDRRYCVLIPTEKGRKVNQAHIKRDMEHASIVAESIDLCEEEVKQTNESLEKLIGFYTEFQRNYH
ncbi:MarR family transcriptional regulator [Roseburia hominis]